MKTNLLLFIITTTLATTQIDAACLNLELAPKEHKVISNGTLWTIHATCQIQTSATKKTIQVGGLKSTSQVNGKSLSEGETTSMTVYDQKTIEVTAEPGAQVSITNMGADSVVAVCST